MEALVITGVGEASYRWVQTDSYNVPPREFRFYRAPIVSAGFFERRSVKEPIVMPVGITRLPIHKLGGLPIKIAYWPDNWLDDWGLKEVCKYFDIKVKEENYGAAGYFVADSGSVVDDQGSGLALQWSEASSTGHEAISQGRPVLHTGNVLSDYGNP